MNKLKVININLTDPYEGTVTFETVTGKQFDAFFWGQKFKINDIYLISFSSPFSRVDWKTNFSKNENKIKTIEKSSKECSFLAYGLILSIKPVTVDFGDIIMELGDWTHDDKVIGEYIYWEIDRLDVKEIKNCA